MVALNIASKSQYSVFFLLVIKYILLYISLLLGMNFQKFILPVLLLIIIGLLAYSQFDMEPTPSPVVVEDSDQNNAATSEEKDSTESFIGGSPPGDFGKYDYQTFIEKESLDRSIIDSHNEFTEKQQEQVLKH
jgi:hypothetical protein